MKRKRYIIIGATLMVIMLILGMSACVYYKHTYTTLHLDSTMCGISLDGIDPNTFCETRGEGTWLEGKFLFAKIGEDGCLILTLKRDVISEWKNTFLDLQVLQCVLGDSRDIGVEVDYTKDFMDYMADAHTCGYEISDDYTEVIVSPEDSHWYYPIIMPACIKMQMLDGKTCSEVRVEFIEVDNNGDVINRIVYPDDIEGFSDITN